MTTHVARLLVAFISLVAAANPAFAAAKGYAVADRAKLSALCQMGGEEKQVCECQAGIVVTSADPRYVQVLVAMSGGALAEDAMKTVAMTADEFVEAAEALDLSSKAQLLGCKSAQ